MVKYAYVTGDAKVGRAKQEHAKVSYKNTHNVLFAIRDMSIPRAQKYLEGVLAHEEIVPYFKFHGGCSRHQFTAKWGVNHGRFPEKSVVAVQLLLKQAAAHAKAQHSVDFPDLYVMDTRCGRAIGHRRRLYRAHGRISAFNSSPCHMQIVVGVRGKKVGAALAK